MTSAAEIRDAIRSGRASTVEVCQATLTRISAVDPALNAFRTVDADAALARAAALDARRNEDGHLPLFGVPVALKDNLCTRALPTTAGSRILERYHPPYDATVVERLEAAGAVIIGKTNCDEFAMGSSTENSAFGPTRNPWDSERTPGGSSGGSAAAVAARLVPLALGSDTGGSIRQPAALCGVVGLKPTYGRVSRYGLLAFASSLDQIGPIATTVADAAACLSVIAGHDPRDATSSTAPVEDYPRHADRRRARAADRRHRAACSATASTPRCSRRAIVALETLREAGAALVDVELPHSAHAIAVYYLVATAEASSNLSRYDGVRYGFRAPERATLGEMYDRTRDDGVRAGGEAADHPRHLRPELGLLRRVLPEGAAGANADSAGLRAGVQGRRRHRDADQPDGGVQARRSRRRSAADVPRRRLHRRGQPGRTAGDQRAVRVHRGAAARSACS